MQKIFKKIGFFAQEKKLLNLAPAGLFIIFSAILFVCVSDLRQLKNDFVDLSTRMDINMQNSLITNSINYKPLIFEAGSDGIAKVNSFMLGFENEPPRVVQLLSYLPHNAMIDKEANVYRKIDSFDDEIPINGYFKISDNKTMLFKPGFYYLRTNLGRFRIVVLEKGMSELDKFYRLFYFYTSISALGRAANYLSGEAALAQIFYSNMYSANYCTGHVKALQSILSSYYMENRMIDFYGFVKEQAQEYPEGHSVLEVFVDGRWIMVDPLFGFIPFDKDGKNPLSFIEFLEARRNNNFQIKTLFRIPDLAFPIEYNENISEEEKQELLRKRESDLFLAGIPTSGKITDYMVGQEIREKMWGMATIIVYHNEGESIYMENDTYEKMTEGDWNKYKNHYSPLLNKFGTGELKAAVSTRIKKELY